MTFYLLIQPPATAFAHPATEQPYAIDSCTDPKDVKAMFTRAEIAHPNDVLILVEELARNSAAIPKVPPELQRAIERWNLVADRVRPKLPKINAISNYVGPYRKWLKKNPDRKYLLEDVVAAFERRTDLHEACGFFGWLLRITPDGTLNSDKVLFGKPFVKNGKTEPATRPKTAPMLGEK